MRRIRIARYLFLLSIVSCTKQIGSLAEKRDRQSFPESATCSFSHDAGASDLFVSVNEVVSLSLGFSNAFTGRLTSDHVAMGSKVSAAGPFQILPLTWAWPTGNSGPENAWLYWGQTGDYFLELHVRSSATGVETPCGSLAVHVTDAGAPPAPPSAPTCSVASPVTSVLTGTSVSLSFTTENAVSANLAATDHAAELITLSSQAFNRQFSWATPGAKTVHLTVTNDVGESDSCSHKIQVEAPADPPPVSLPSCSITPSSGSFLVGQAISFTVSTSNTQTATVTTTDLTTETVTPNGSPFTRERIWSTPGQKTITVSLANGSLSGSCGGTYTLSMPTPPGAVCGNGVQEGSEGCDDGNRINTDFCKNNCRVNVCNDGVVWNGIEACDDGNALNTDGCTTACALPACGDGFVQEFPHSNEQCDDGNTRSADGCDRSCRAEGEACVASFTRIEGQGGNFCYQVSAQFPQGRIPTSVTLFQPQYDITRGPNAPANLTQFGSVYCSQWRAFPTEGYLDNEILGEFASGPSSACRVRIESTPTCVVGQSQSVARPGRPVAITVHFTNTVSGNLVSTEQAPIGLNALASPSSLSLTWGTEGPKILTVQVFSATGAQGTCTGEVTVTDSAPAFCGDGFADGQECDDGNLVSGDGCSSSCEYEDNTCGNGVVEHGEECDDGNSNNSDNCTSSCLHARCGDGFVYAGLESCDYGFQNGGLVCSSTCQFAACPSPQHFFDTLPARELMVLGDNGLVSLAFELPREEEPYHLTVGRRIGTGPLVEIMNDFFWRSSLITDFPGSNDLVVYEVTVRDQADNVLSSFQSIVGPYHPGRLPAARVLVAGASEGVTTWNALSGQPIPGSENDFSLPFSDPSVAFGTFGGDLIQDIVAGSGPGTASRVIVVNGSDGSELRNFQPYGGFPGGVFVATGDLNRDSVSDVITAPRESGGPHVRVFDGKTGNELFGFMAYAPSFIGGVRVASADITGDGVSDIITGAGPGGSPHIRVFDGLTRQVAAGAIGGFYAYGASFSGGVYVAAADVNADGYADVITGAGAGGGPHVRVFSGRTGEVISQFMAYAPSFGGGVRVAAADFNGDGRADIVTSPGPGGGPHVRVFDGATLSEITGFLATGYPTSGLFIGVMGIPSLNRY